MYVNIRNTSMIIVPPSTHTHNEVNSVCSCFKKKLIPGLSRVGYPPSLSVDHSIGGNILVPWPGTMYG